jgi:hypothetical protein
MHGKGKELGTGLVNAIKKTARTAIGGAEQVRSGRCAAEGVITMRYPVTLSKDDNGTFLVRFADVPEAITYGDTKEEALGTCAGRAADRV